MQGLSATTAWLLTWSEDVDRLLRRVDNVQVGVDGVVGREERRDRALMSAFARFESTVVVGCLMVVADRGSGELHHR